jgi:hypothetical protein
MYKEDEDCFKECKVRLDGSDKVLDPYPDTMKLAEVRSFVDKAKMKNLELMELRRLLARGRQEEG